ncbi:MAG: 4Fe-4S binding protein [Eggerthellaceae bacterium]|nr:4Fe-4S binding protein [Eggerthellaceae bacterium]
MSSFKLGGMILGSVFKKPETVMYPLEQKVAPAGLRGMVSIEAEKCILCGICQRGCPCSAITVEKKERTWAINPFSCIQCGACVYACPKDCLIMDPGYTKPCATKSVITVEVPDLKSSAE